MSRWGSRFGTPFDEATSVVAVGQVWDCAINGVPYRMDRSAEEFKQGLQTIAAIRDQADNSALPGEQSISRQELWRVGQQSWHKGAGQVYYDKADSDPERFFASQGIDPWTKNRFSLLHGVSGVSTHSASNEALISVNGWLYHSYGSNIERSNDGNVWTAVTGTSGAVRTLTTDGSRIWVATASGTYSGDTTSSALSATGWTLPSPMSGAALDRIAYVNNRLIGIQGRYIADINGSGTFTVLNPNESAVSLTWAAITDGTSAIYGAGTNGNRSRLYSIRIDSNDPSAELGPPIPATPWLPTDEVVWDIYEYLGLVCIGTSAGLRVAQKISDYTGREILSVGPLTYIGTTGVGQPVRALNGDGQYVYFGWDNFDSTHTGLGRLNLGQATDNLVYAYASDIQANQLQGHVTAIASLGGKQYFTVQSGGVWGESNYYVDSGWIDSGIIRYQLIDSKVAQRVELRQSSVAGTVSAAISADGANFVTVGQADLQGSVTPALSFAGKQLAAVDFNVKVTLEASDSNTETPVIQHVELRSSVIPTRGDTFLVPLLLEENDTDYFARNPSDDFETLRELARSKHTATYQELSKVFNVIVLDYQFVRDRKTQDGRWWNGTLILKMMAPAS